LQIGQHPHDNPSLDATFIGHNKLSPLQVGARASAELSRGRTGLCLLK
jgi:hypothetical protein